MHGSLQLEFAPGQFVSCQVIRTRQLCEGWLELMYWNPILEELDYTLEMNPDWRAE